MSALAATTALAALSAPARAQQAAETVDLGRMILTAAGVAVDPLTAPASVSVVTGEELQRTGATSLADAVRNVPGVAVAGASDAENIFIRGLPSEYTLILIDGKRINTRDSRPNASGGVDQYFFPPVASIDRIEIVRGPMSSLHGSDAMGGVINIITKPVGDRWGGSFTLEGTLPQDDVDSAEQQASFNLSGPIIKDRLSLQIWGRALAREGSERIEAGREVGPGTRKIQDINARLAWTLAPAHRLTFDIGRARIDTDPRLDSRLTAALGYTGVIAGWDITSGLSFENALRETTGSARQPEMTNTVFDVKGSRSFDWIGRHTLTLGGQVMRSTLTDFNPGLANNQNVDFSNGQNALFIEDIWQVAPRFSLTLGTRYTRDDRFGGKLTPRIYALWKMSEGWYLGGGVSTGYRTPTLRETSPNYFLTTDRGRAVIGGNPDLKPEESTSYEVSLRHQGDRARLALAAFHTDFSNKVEDRDTGGSITLNGRRFRLFEYFNVGAAKIQGAELSAGYFITPALEISGGYTWTRSERLDGPLAGTPLSRMPKQQASLRLDWRTPVHGLDLWIAGRHFGESVAVASTGRGNTITRNKPYTTVDVGAQYRINDIFTLNAAVRNAGDARITQSRNGTAPNGRTLYLGLTGTF